MKRKSWGNQWKSVGKPKKQKKIKTKLGFVIRTWLELRNTTPPRERKSHKTEIVPNRWLSSSMGSPCALWDFSVSGFQRKSDKSCVFVGFVWAMFLNFFGLFQGMKILLWAFFKGWKFCNFLSRVVGWKNWRVLFFFFTPISRVF